MWPRWIFHFHEEQNNFQEDGRSYQWQQEFMHESWLKKNKPQTCDLLMIKKSLFSDLVKCHLTRRYMEESQSSPHFPFRQIFYVISSKYWVITPWVTSFGTSHNKNQIKRILFIYLSFSNIHLLFIIFLFFYLVKNKQKPLLANWLFYQICFFYCYVFTMNKKILIYLSHSLSLHSIECINIFS